MTSCRGPPENRFPGRHEPVLLGIDSGQTACKAVLFDLDGREVATCVLRNVLSSPQPRWMERDPDALWLQVATAVRSVLDRAAETRGSAVNVLGVGVAGHGDGMYLVERSGKAARAAIVATDSRAYREAADLSSGSTGSRALQLTGQVPFAASPAALWRWLAQREPEVMARGRWALFCKDFIRLRLTGQVATDPSDASASFTDVRSQTWSPEALALFGLTELDHLLPPIERCDDVVGTVTAAAAGQTGLPAGIPVVTGAHDVDAAALGVGAHETGAASAILGTFSINQVVSDVPRVDRR